MKKFKITPSNAPYFFMLPGILLFLTFGLYPIIQTFIYSFQDKMGNTPGTFVMFENYIRALNDSLFIVSLKNIAIIFLMQAPLMIFLSLVLAFILNMESTKFKSGWRTALFLPNVTNAVAYTFIFKIMLSNDGLLNEILEYFNIEGVAWMTDPFRAKWVIAIMLIWRWTGYNMVIFLAAMQNISKEVYESAAVDGASKIRQFFHITVPLMKNPIIFTTIMTINGTLGIFAETQLLENGGPNFGTYTPSLLIYNTAWSQYDFGYASALSYLISMITIVIALIQFNVGKEKD